MMRRISFAAPIFVALMLLAGIAPAIAGAWRPIGPEGGSVHVLATSPGKAGVVYAVTGRGAVLASSDGAASWSSRGPGPFIRELAVDPARPEILYASTVQSLIKSVDGGKSWSGSLLDGYIWAFQVAPSSPDVIYASRNKAAFQQEVVKSTDGGATWTAISFSEDAVFQLAVDPGDPRVVYASNSKGVFRSGDGGGTWQNASSGLGLSFVARLVIDPRQPSTLYAGGSKIFRSTDQGATWSLVWDGPGQFAHLKALSVDPASGALYSLFSTSEGDRVFRSRDGGASWIPVFSRRETQTLAVGSQAPGRLYVGTRAGGAYRSENGGDSWKVANHGLRELAFTTVAADPHTPGLLFAVALPEGFLSPQVLLRSTNGGATWSSPFGSPEASPLAGDVIADPSRPGTWYLAAGLHVLKTRDGGRIWENASRGFRFPELVFNLALAPANPDGLYAIGWETMVCDSSNCPRIIVYRSVDGAAQWRRSRVLGQGPGFLLSSLAVDAVDSSTVYAAGPGIFKSTDGGVSWAKTGSGIRDAIADLVADPFSKGTLYAAVWQPQGSQGKRVFKSLDAGKTWGRAAGGLPSGIDVYDLTPDPRVPETLYAATSGGVYVTRNGGGLWKAMNEGLGDRPVWTVSVDPLRPGRLYAGCGDGLYEFSE